MNDINLIKKYIDEFNFSNYEEWKEVAYSQKEVASYFFDKIEKLTIDEIISNFEIYDDFITNILFDITIDNKELFDYMLKN